MITKWPAMRLLLSLCLLLPGVAQSEQFSIVLVPDTQTYVEINPAVFEAQIAWIVANQAVENIIYVVHLGDLKDDFSCDNKTVGGRTEWEIVNDTFLTLEGANIPYGVVPGNHDFDQLGGGCPNWDTQRPLTLYNSVFGPTRFNSQPYYGDLVAGTPGNRVPNSNEDNFTLFGFCGVKFIAINLAYKQAANTAGNDAEVIWADNLLQAYPDRLGIVTTHYFLEQNAEVGSGGPFNRFGPYGQEVYDGLSDNPNLFMMLSAHKRGEAWRVENRSASGLQPVQVLLQDYQSVNYPPNPSSVDYANLDGNASNFTDGGFMRIMRFDTDTGLVNIETFTPAIPALGRSADLVSDYFPADGAGMDKDTASNISFSFQGYGSTVSQCATDSDNDFIEDQFDNCPFVPNGPTSSFCATGSDGGRCSPEFQLALIARQKQSYINCLISQGVPAQEATMNREFGICTFDLFRGLLLDSYGDACGGSACNGIQEDSDGDGIGNACD
ncbi:MAG: metallophosphoesterase [Gammaproteobacteria bacterium]|nr:metallophosphoesterase [Gammaproteobacteria bacterium]MDH3536784.1 metallophosphoesterase [Gammaproteobacteria bacterium]